MNILLKYQARNNFNKKRAMLTAFALFNCKKNYFTVSRYSAMILTLILFGTIEPEGLSGIPAIVITIGELFEIAILQGCIEFIFTDVAIIVNIVRITYSPCHKESPPFVKNKF